MNLFWYGVLRLPLSDCLLILHNLQLLRSTLPVLQELEGIRRDTALARRKIPSRPKPSIIYKGAAWFRILYNTT